MPSKSCTDSDNYAELKSLREKNALIAILQSAEAKQKEDRLVLASAQDAEDLAEKQLYEANARAFALERSLRQHTPDSKSEKTTATICASQQFYPRT